MCARHRSPARCRWLDRADSHVLSGDGKLDVVDNLISADSGTFGTCVFDNTDNGLWPSTCACSCARSPVAWSSRPRRCCGLANGVYVVQGDNTVKMQTARGVEVGDSQVQIAEGLKGGERVVSEGQFRLKPGSGHRTEAGSTPEQPSRGRAAERWRRWPSVARAERRRLFSSRRHARRRRH